MDAQLQNTCIMANFVSLNVSPTEGKNSCKDNLFTRIVVYIDTRH